MGLKLNKQDLN